MLTSSKTVIEPIKYISGSDAIYLVDNMFIGSLQILIMNLNSHAVCSASDTECCLQKS